MLAPSLPSPRGGGKMLAPSLPSPREGGKMLAPSLPFPKGGGKMKTRKGEGEEWLRARISAAASAAMAGSTSRRR
jgi:hypothetical protein